MTSKKPSSNIKIVFFGTGPTSLEALQGLTSEFEVVLVVTKPPAKNSAGKHFNSPVHEWSIKNNLQVIAPANKDELNKELASKDFADCLGIVLDYGMIIPESVIGLFSKGILNSHFSLLPQYRGANPIRAAILNGDKTTGITIIKITPELDNGPILTWALVDVGSLNAIDLRAKLSEINCPLLCETVRLYMNDELDMVEQDETEASYTRKTTKDDGKLDSNKSAKLLAREVRAYVGWPKSSIEIAGKVFIIHQASASTQKVEKSKLEVIGGKLYYGCKSGSLEIKNIQPSGKASMDAKSFINGYFGKL